MDDNARTFDDPVDAPHALDRLLEGILMEPARDLRHDFERSLDDADDVFVEAALQIVEAMPRLTRAFLAGEERSIDDARAMAADVQEKIASVEDRGFVILARQSPVGGDLRRLVALLRLCTDVDRSASLLRHVSETLRRFDPRDLPEDTQRQLGEIAERSMEVFRGGVDAWRSRDGLAVNEIDEMDEDVDKLQLQLLSDAAEHPELGDAMLVLGLIARYYERIADHGVALARDVAFVVTGERVGHR